ncbi:ABC-2 type transporter [Eremomyces bilateralis CBS 781.70]|uniref:ABC-2 type transporter n=1 Tax=Eremomyces bilateralis CBS 781.70 TaxID=1392243 RepID=A0A6G1G708_9PEZI|nr:ABC-2 type transporter [Eremomyces bilateralis CBS 781.70]KAF1813814.1 ABC-2 type transporter [Eremomyces bilateralis CBS 781.70]
MNKEVSELVRSLTNMSHSASSSLFPVQQNSPLDPNGSLFSARLWAKSFFDLRTSTSGGNPPRTTGISWTNLNAYGFGSATGFQKSVGNVFLDGVNVFNKLFCKEQQRIDILRDLDGVVHSGEMFAVLGPPGSGCSTLLRTIAGDTYGFHVDANINYSGIPPKKMRTAFRGEAIYTAEVDDHFPHLTVGDTLYFAARARCPKNIPEDISRVEYAEHLRDVIMAMFGISHTKNTRVGDQYIRGVSGGERKRVTIAEAALSYSPLQCWDNSTRGLDSANAIEFCRALRTQADIMGSTSCVALYQAPQAAYELFHKVIVLYEGRQIFFGKTSEAKSYFEELGFVCPEQQTTADFLTSMTNASERIIKPGWESRTPRSSEEFAQAWKNSQHRARLMIEIEDYNRRHPFGGDHYQKFLESRKIDQSDSQREKSPFTLSYLEQAALTMWRSWTLLKSDPSVTVAMLILNIFEGLILSSVLYNVPADTTGFFGRCILLFMVVLLNAFGSILEIMTLYAKRRVVEKHSRYALYHPSAEALSAMVVDLPYKIVNATIVNMALYFMGNLRREPGPFFFFYLFSIVTVIMMSMMFRFIGSVTKSMSQAMGPASIILLIIVLYSGFAIPPKYMLGWIGWTRWLNPIYYAIESVFLNEFSGRPFPCANFIPSGPGYEFISGMQRACSTAGSVPGQDFVDGSAFVEASFGFVNSHKWRNLGILAAFLIFFLALHLVATEYVASERSKGEVLVFTRRALAKLSKRMTTDIEIGEVAKSSLNSPGESEKVTGMEDKTSVFHWQNICYDIKIKGEQRRILDHVDGWIKPGTLTALMGVSGAGKTTLLDVLASRVTMGVISGSMLVDGKLRDRSFQRKTGYVQQQDLHLHTSTVREALNFSALLRQPARYSRQEKLDYVDTVITLLDMEDYADAVIGVPGEGLNVEQRKRLTIAVELAARPDLLLFLDEPTSGLDSQTSWSISSLMKKLTGSGQAVLCTIHQPSAVLFQRFDRLLLLASGGRTVYFGEIGKNSKVLVDYFVRHGAPDCLPGTNPAEYMLEVIGAAPGAHTDIDWPALWRTNPEYQEVQHELVRLSNFEKKTEPSPKDALDFEEFAAPFSVQFLEVTNRVLGQYWRSPSYIYSKALLSIGTVLLIGLSFINAENTSRGLQNQMFGVLMVLMVFPQIVNQTMPTFISQRTLYEARERPSKAYSWQAFFVANILVETLWNSLMAVFCFVCWYFPIGLYRNAAYTDSVHSRAITLCLLVWMFLVFSSTFTYLVIAGLDSAELGGVIVTLLFIMMYAFCGIIAPPNELPGFWIFMYRVNPLTYIVDGFLGTALANAPMRCASEEIIHFMPPIGRTCGEYLTQYIDNAGGSILNPNAGNNTECQYCPVTDTNSFLTALGVSFDNRWMDFGLMWVFCVFNIVAALGLYWLVRVPKNKKVKKE